MPQFFEYRCVLLCTRMLVRSFTAILGDACVHDGFADATGGVAVDDIGNSNHVFSAIVVFSGAVASFHKWCKNVPGRKVADGSTKTASLPSLRLAN